jgi:hypothetical protein
VEVFRTATALIVRSMVLSASLLPSSGSISYYEPSAWAMLPASWPGFGRRIVG